ncbi:MAG: TetR/AcrR family transcriptional regulator [Alcanivoracaceae bacterium]|nr:TetR/AcrR family transcriptional regulator [Alcanivoracaceae bacterium]
MTSATSPYELDAIREIINRVLSAQRDDGPAGRAHARTEILIHSIAVFSRRGLERTTVQDLLDAASISRRTFYKYFRNKFDVLESIYQISVENMILRFRREAERSRSVQEVIRNSCNIYFDYHLSLGPIIRLMMEEARRADSVLAPHRATAYTAVAGVMKSEMLRVTGRELDELVYLTLIWTLESYSLYLLNDTDCSAETIARYKQIMTGIAEAVLSGQADWAKLAVQPPV